MLVHKYSVNSSFATRDSVSVAWTKSIAAPFELSIPSLQIQEFTVYCTTTYNFVHTVGVAHCQLTEALW